ncbi:MAG: glycosyltransferase family 32 protein [Bacilli bacterium]
MQKYIHYCWFGGKPLPRLAKKCIKSWKKFLPDYEIIEWNENNFDVNITKFSKEAYNAKKWAFVSDVARIYALKNFGGIYFDTDMLVKKNIDYLLNDEVFAGWESEYNVAVGVLYSKEKNHPLINELWDVYNKIEFNVESMFSFSIPTLLSNILKNKYNLKFDHLHNQLLDNGIKIYARDYFYPISSDQTPNMFTKNTCMVHYYIGSWLSNSDIKRIKFQMIFGKNIGNFILNFLVKIKHLIKKVLKVLLYPIYKSKKNKDIQKACSIECNNILKQFDTLKNSDYIVFYNQNWLGTKNATKELFENTIGISELFYDSILNTIYDKVIESKTNLVIFSAFAKGWDKLIKLIKDYDNNITIKIVWHGSHAMNVESYDWEMFEKMFKLYNDGLIDSIGFVKKSMYDFYKLKGYNVELLLNTVHIKKQALINNDISNKNSSVTKIGLYASGDRWVKNFYNQLAAASLFKNAEIDCVPLGEKSLKMARIFKIGLSGLNGPIPHDDLLKRLSKNDINFYVTFSECAPMIPLESLELGVPCITGNNHHYWEGTELEKYLIVNENDNIIKIYEQADYCLKNKEKIISLYKSWKKEYDKKSKESVKKFLNIKN